MNRLHFLNRLTAVALTLLCVFGLMACKDNSTNDGVDPDPYSFVVDGVTITPGGKAASVLASLASRAPSVSAQGSCLGGVDGEDVNYVYSGFSLQTFRLSEGHPDEEIRWIILTDDSVSTQRGIRIGSSLQAVKDAYGVGTETPSLITYLSAGTYIRFSLRDGIVTGISYTVAD